MPQAAWIERAGREKDGRDFAGPIPVILGPTGSGKTGVGVEIAQEINGEIISADSRTIYQGMDIGTAKPSLVERAGVLHFGFDLVKPGERFTVADWKKYAEGKIREIERRDGVPLIVGGTGLYIDALVFNYQFEQENCTDPEADRAEMDKRFKLFGIKWKREELKERLKLRASKMFTQELFDETEKLVKQYGWDNQAMKSDIYQFAWGYMKGQYSLKEAVELTAIDDWHLAKRQLTWFNRNKEIVWLPLEKIKAGVIKCIQNEQRK